MEIQKYKKLLLNINQCIDINNDNILEKNEKLPVLYQKVLRNYSNILLKCNQYTVLKNKKYGELFEFYKYNDNKAWSTKIEIESQINRNKDYCKLNLKINRYEVMLKELEMSLKNIHNSLYVIKNLIEYRKMFGV